MLWYGSRHKHPSVCLQFLSLAWSSLFAEALCGGMTVKPDRVFCCYGLDRECPPKSPALRLLESDWNTEALAKCVRRQSLVRRDVSACVCFWGVHLPPSLSPLLSDSWLPWCQKLPSAIPFHHVISSLELANHWLNPPKMWLKLNLFPLNCGRHIACPIDRKAEKSGTNSTLIYLRCHHYLILYTLNCNSEILPRRWWLVA